MTPIENDPDPRLVKAMMSPRGDQTGVAGEIAHIGAGLIHDGEALDAALLRPGFVDEDDTRIEITFLAGDALVDLVGNDVGDAPHVVGLAKELLAVEIVSGEYVPQPVFDLVAAVLSAADAAGDERLRVDHAPILKARIRVDRLDALD